VGDRATERDEQLQGLDSLQGTDFAQAGFSQETFCWPATPFPGKTRINSLVEVSDQGLTGAWSI